MKLTIIPLPHFSAQDRIDLGKIWPSQDLTALRIDDNHRIYAARFNDRLLAAVRVVLHGAEGQLAALCVREVTRRRGVGKYLIEEALAAHPQVRSWQMANTDIEDNAVMTAFMQALGFTSQQDGWVKRS